MPSDRESLLAAWEAIGPSQPLCIEAQDLLLAYFQHVESHGEETARMNVSAAQTMDHPLPPPARFVRLQRTSKKPPSGPALAKSLQSCEAKPELMFEKNEHSVAVKSIFTVTFHVGMESIANGPI